MSNNNESVHDFEVNLICEYFSTTKRQGPGSEEATLKALSFIDKLNSNSSIADIGCGTGGQTMILAGATQGEITGIDLFPIFIEKFNQSAFSLNLSHRVKGVVGNMESLPFKENELDLIWCEGAIYNIGYEKGLREWSKYLKTGGYIAITEAAWFTPQRPEEIERFWVEAYPGIDTIPVKVRQMQECGYMPVATFILPDKCWTDNFFKPQERARELFLQKYPNDPTAKALVEYAKKEAELYSKYGAYYGYVFLIGKKL